MPAETLKRSSGGALILAAGFGRRFGSDKRRYRLPHGRTLLEATIERYALVYSDLCVVLRPDDEELETGVRALPASPRIAHAAEAALGMGHSLAAGIRAIEAEWDWASVALGDMPFVSTDTLNELLDRFFAAGADTIVQPEYQGQPGHPVTFPARCFPEMTRLEGDQGARQILERAGRVIRHPVADRGVLEDLDVPP